MIITCKQCATEYFLDEDRIKPSGSKVKCSKCQNLFVAFPPAGGDPAAGGDPGGLAAPSNTSGIQPTSEQIPASPVVSSLAGLEETDMPDLSGGMNEFSDTDASISQSLSQLDEEPLEPPVDMPGTDAGEDQAMNDLTDELDKILGSEEMSGQTTDSADEDLLFGADEPGIKQGEDVDVDLLDDELDQLFGGPTGEKTGLSDDGPAAYDTDIEMLDLSELDDDIEETSALERAGGDDASDADASDDILSPEGGIDLDSIDIDGLGSADVHPAKENSAASPAVSALSQSEDMDMAELTAGLGEMLGPDTATSPSLETPPDKEPEGQEINELTDELDKILGSDEITGDDPGPYDSSVDELDLSELDVELDEMFKPELAADDPAENKETSARDSEDDIGLDTVQIQELDSEIEKIEEITPKTKDGAEIQELSDLGIEIENLEIPGSDSGPTDLKTDSDQDGANILDSEKIDNLGLDLDLEHLEASEKEASESEDDFTLETEQIEDLDFNLDIEDIEGESDQSAKTEDIILDTQQIDGLDLEFDDLESTESEGNTEGPTDESDTSDDVVLDTLQIEGLDLELEEIDIEEAALDNSNFPLDTAQIKSLDLELEDIETTEPETDSESSFDKDASISLDTKKGKQAEVLNVNLERPDLDGGFSKSDEIDLPILDELLAPAEVVDESLMEGLGEGELTFSADGKISEDDILSVEVEDVKDQEKVQFPIESESLAMEEIEMEMSDKAEAGIQPDAIAGSEQKDMPRVDAKESKGTATDTLVSTATAAAATTAYPAKKSRKSIIALLLIALLAAGLYAITAMGIKVPYISDLIGGNKQQVVNDRGTALLKTVGIDSKFTTSKKNGNLFIITGKIMNQYDHDRTAVLIKGSIFTKGGKLVRAKSVYCGNILSDKDIETKPFADIQKYLSNNTGNGNAGSLKVSPGKTLPFMIVLDNLPADIEEYSVKVIKSTAL